MIKAIRDRLTYAATFWKREVRNGGVRLSLREASLRMRFALLTGYELEDARLARAVLRPEDRVLELGSSIGFVALYCQLVLGIRDFAMVEANPRLLPLIHENFRLNGASPPPLYNLAAGPEDGTASFTINRDFWSSSTIERANGREQVTVPQRSIPSIVAELPFRPNTLIIDIEGGEAAIPIAHWLAFDTIIGEFHERLVGSAAIRGITDALIAAGYAEIARDGCSRAFRREAAGSVDR